MERGEKSEARNICVPFIRETRAGHKSDGNNEVQQRKTEPERRKQGETKGFSRRESYSRVAIAVVPAIIDVVYRALRHRYNKKHPSMPLYIVALYEAGTRAGKSGILITQRSQLKKNLRRYSFSSFQVDVCICVFRVFSYQSNSTRLFILTIHKGTERMAWFI